MANKVRAVRSDGIRSRKAILEAAARLATVEGLNGLSIARLADYIGMSKSGLFAHFGSKEELQLATVEMATEMFNSQVVAPAQELADPVKQMEALCLNFLRYLEDEVFPGGCFFASGAAEFDTHPGAVRDRIAASQRQWLEALEELTRQGQKLGTIAESEDPAQLAFDLDAFILMANGTYILHRDPAFLRRARHAVSERIARARASQT